MKLIQQSYGIPSESSGVEPEIRAAEPMAAISPTPDPVSIDYTVTALLANLYRIDAETGEARKHSEIPMGTILNVIGEHDHFCICTFEDSDDVFCVDRADIKEGIFLVSPENGVDLRFVLPDAVFEILFASESNITGHALYPSIPMLETKTSEMLKEAASLFAADGYKLKIYDSYRPKSAQYELFNIVRDSRFIADPYVNNSFHQIGRAVDLSLIDTETGSELRMPTSMHTFNEQAARYNRNAWSEEERQNVDYLTDVMVRCGFRSIETEWWHFENGEPGNYMDPNLDYESLPLESEESLLEMYPQFRS